MDSKPCAPISVLIYGHYGGHNTGDEAMLYGLLRGLDYDGLCVRVVRKEGELPAWLLDSGAELVSPSAWAVIRNVKSSDWVMLGGGTHFHDDYAWPRVFRHFQYMIRIAGLSGLARLLGRKSIWLGVGIGPMRYPLTRFLAWVGVTCCHSVSLRDHASLEEISTWRSGRRASVDFDLAALLPLPNEIVPISKPMRTLGVSLSRLIDSRMGQVQNPDVLASVGFALGTAMQQNPDLRIRILVLRGGSREDDISVSLDLLERLERIDPGRVQLWPYDPDPSACLDVVGSCDGLLGMRFHSIVLAYLAERPILALSYHRKVADLAMEIGLPSTGLLDLAHALSRDEICARIYEFIASPTHFRPSLARHEAVGRAQRGLDRLLSGVMN